jgi:hypothetical protein
LELSWIGLVICHRFVLARVGCADAPLAVERVESGQLLHQRIEHVASDVVGIDIMLIRFSFYRVTVLTPFV